MERSCKNYNGFQSILSNASFLCHLKTGGRLRKRALGTVNYFRKKSSIMVVWQDFKYTSGNHIKYLKVNQETTKYVGGLKYKYLSHNFMVIPDSFDVK